MGNRIPRYQAKVDRQVVVGGDTLSAISFHLKREADNSNIVPVSVCAVIQNKAGRTIFKYAPEIAADGTVTLPQISGQGTKELLNRASSYAVQYTLADGCQRTYFTGSITLLEGGPVCQN